MQGIMFARSFRTSVVVDLDESVLSLQTRTVQSYEVDTMLLPSGENTIELISSVWCRSKSGISKPDIASHARIVPCNEPDIIILSSGENTKEVADSLSPRNENISRPDSRLL